MNRIVSVLILIVGLLLCAAPGHAREIPLTQYNALRGVEVLNTESGLELRFEFKNQLQQKLEPHFYKRSVQLDFDLTYVDPPKRYYPIENSSLSQIYVSQFDSRLMRVRFMLAEENSLRKGDIEFKKNGRVLTVRVKEKSPAYDDSLDALIDRAVAVSRQPVLAEPQEIEEPVGTEADLAGIVEPVLETAASRREEISPSSQPVAMPAAKIEPLGELKEEALPRHQEPVPLKLKDSEPEQTLLVSNENEMESSSLWSSAVRMVSTLAFVVGLMFLIFHLFKKWVGKQGGMFGGGEKAIRVISTGFLGPKKSIAMVEVAGRVLILGVANDQITLLSKLENEEEIERLLKKKPAAEERTNSKTIVIPSTQEHEAKKNGTPAGTDGKPDLYTSRKVRTETASKENGKKFSGYVKEYTAPEKKKTRTVNDLKRMIRQRTGKVQVSA